MKTNKKSRKWAKIAVGMATVAAIGTAALLLQPTATAQEPQIFALSQGNLSRIISTSGVVQSANSQNIYSTQTAPIQDIFVNVGDSVQAGDVLARLDMSRLESDIEQAALNLTNAENSATEEGRNNANSVANAQNSLTASQISLERQSQATANALADLQTAIADTEQAFDGTTHDRIIEDARLAAERRTADFAAAQADLRQAEQDLANILEEFDDYNHQNAIADARITLERRQIALSDAEEELAEELRNRNEPFNDRALRQAIADAERNLERRREDLQAAEQNTAASWGNENVNHETLQTNERNARRAVEDAESAVTRARTDLTTARNNHNSSQSDVRENALTAAERAVDNAQTALEDAQRAYDRATADLPRALQTATESAENAVELASENAARAHDSMLDAQRNHERTLYDKEQAILDFLENSENRLQAAQRTYADSQNQLQTAENSLQSAQTSLNQAAARSATTTNVELQALNLARLNEQLADGYIIATTGGVITEINASVGAAPTGILFVIEDFDNLYISANVREHNLNDIILGQNAQVTAVATGDRVYSAEVAYISPRAVSPPGSTSVEFEVRAALTGTTADVRIGMNAFLNIVTDFRENVFSVPLTAISSTANGDFIYQLADGEIVAIPITIGLRTATHAEVFGELFEGMEILARAEDGVN